MNQPSVFYLATPFSHPDHQIRHDRYVAALRIAGRLMKDGWIVYSPILHDFPISSNFAMPTDFGFWERADKAMIFIMAGVIVCHLPGMEKSLGMQAEIKYAKELKKLVLNLEPKPEDIEGLRLE